MLTVFSEKGEHPLSVKNGDPWYGTKLHLTSLSAKSVEYANCLSAEE